MSVTSLYRNLAWQVFEARCKDQFKDGLVQLLHPVTGTKQILRDEVETYMGSGTSSAQAGSVPMSRRWTMTEPLLMSVPATRHDFTNTSLVRDPRTRLSIVQVSGTARLSNADNLQSFQLLLSRVQTDKTRDLENQLFRQLEAVKAQMDVFRY